MNIIPNLIHIFEIVEKRQRMNDVARMQRLLNIGASGNLE